MFQFPNWSIELPGRAYNGGDPDGFSHKSEVLEFVEDYAACGVPHHCRGWPITRSLALTGKPACLRCFDSQQLLLA